MNHVKVGENTQCGVHEPGGMYPWLVARCLQPAAQKHGGVYSVHCPIWYGCEAVKLDTTVRGDLRCVQESVFVHDVAADIRRFLDSGYPRSVLIFPPVNSYRRFLIHRVCSDESEELSTFSIGEGSGRRTVVCYKKHLLNGKPLDAGGDGCVTSECSKAPVAMVIERQCIAGNSSTAASEHFHKPCGKRGRVPALNIYRPPAARRLDALVCPELPPGSTITTPTVKTEKARITKQRRPDIQVYVPRAKRTLQPQADTSTAAKLLPLPEVAHGPPTVAPSINTHHKSRSRAADDSLLPASHSWRNVGHKQELVPADSTETVLLDCKTTAKSVTVAALSLQDSVSDVPVKDSVFSVGSFVEPDDNSVTDASAWSQSSADNTPEQSGRSSPVPVCDGLSVRSVDVDNTQPSSGQTSNCVPDSISKSGYERGEVFEDLPSRQHDCQLGEEHPVSECKVEEVDRQHEQNRKNRHILRGNYISDVLIISDPVPESASASAPPVTAREVSAKAPSEVSLHKKKNKKCQKVESQREEKKKDDDIPVVRLNPDECTWDMMYDDNGECLDPRLMDELTSAVGSVTITSPQSDYSCYQTKSDLPFPEPGDEFSHVVEIYNFPPEFKTQDLLSVFSPYKNGGFEIKWVDDTHALGVFSSALVAADVLAKEHPFVKTRPLRDATPESQTKARRSAEFMQPYRPRPETCMALARRLVTGALGVRLTTTREEREAERRQLNEAREKRRLVAKQRDEAWEGTLGK